MDLNSIPRATPGTGRTDAEFVEHTLSKSYTYGGQVYDQNSKSVPVEVAIKDRYRQAKAQAIADGTPAHELPRLSDVLRQYRAEKADQKAWDDEFGNDDTGADGDGDDTGGDRTAPGQHAARPDPQGHANPPDVSATAGVTAGGQPVTGGLPAGPQADDVVLGDDFPHVAKLRAQKPAVTTYGEARAVTDHTKLDGIGDTRWADIQKALAS